MKFNENVVSLFFIIAATQAEYVPALAEMVENFHRSPVTNSTDIQIKWIEQKLDHFSEDNRTWRMRYMESSKYYNDGGPIFVFVGGESPIQESRIQSGIICDLAKTHHGILFHTEHRFYGESQPTGDLSTESMRYLNFKQALADLAHFIKIKNGNNGRSIKSKVILCGCSYSARMAVWFSKIYPALVDGVFASSAPFLAQLDFKEYHEIVGQAFQQLGSQKCYDRIQNGVAKLEAMFGDYRAEEALNRLRLCSSFKYTNQMDLWNLFAMISIRFAGIVQHQSGPGIVINFCEKIMTSSDDLIIFDVIFPKTIKGCINASYTSTMKYFTKSSKYRAWQYQACNEFGWFKTSTSSKQPFGSSFPISFYVKLCSDLFGVKYSRDNMEKFIKASNIFFGSKTPLLNLSKIYMTQGGLDPWHPLGYDKSRGDSLIPKASHCANMGSISKDDSVEMRASKEKLISLVLNWLR